MLALTLNPDVGVAPGTTTMQIDQGQRCLGVCPPGYFDQAAAPLPLPSDANTERPRVLWDPYGTESKLMGLRGLRGAVRWDLFALATGLGFAGVVAFFLIKRR